MLLRVAEIALQSQFDDSIQSDRSDKLVLTKTGTGGLSELKEVLDDSKASFAYVRVSYSNDKESTREKFILVVGPCFSANFAFSYSPPCPPPALGVSHFQVWIGPSCKVMRKAKVR